MFSCQLARVSGLRRRQKERLTVGVIHRLVSWLRAVLRIRLRADPDLTQTQVASASTPEPRPSPAPTRPAPNPQPAIQQRPPTSSARPDAHPEEYRSKPSAEGTTDAVTAPESQPAPSLEMEELASTSPKPATNHPAPTPTPEATSGPPTSAQTISPRPTAGGADPLSEPERAAHITEPKRQIPAEDRGGARRGQRCDAPSPRKQKQEPELRIQLHGMAWELILECGCSEPPRQRGEALTARASDQWQVRWPLEKIELNSAEIIPANPYRIFKLAGQQHAYGRPVTKIGTGDFLILIQLGWSVTDSQRQTLIGDGATAHRLTADETRPAPLLSDGALRQSPIPRTTSNYQLEGEALVDNLGCPLYFSSGPTLKQLNGAALPVKCVAIEERTRERWHGGDWGDAEAWLQANSPGWFTLRLYGSSDELLQSLEFRYVAQLNRVHMDCPALPGPAGHANGLLEIWHDDGLQIRAPGGPTIERNGGRSTIAIPPDPSLLSIVLTMQVGDNLASAELPTQRLWWRLDDESGTAADWAARPLSLPREGFRPDSTKRLTIRLPAPGWASGIRAGLGANRRPYIENHGTCEIALRELGTELQLIGDTQSRQTALHLDISHISGWAMLTVATVRLRRARYPPSKLLWLC